jgi:hypothetical protein
MKIELLAIVNKVEEVSGFKNECNKNMVQIATIITCLVEKESI